MSAVLRDDPADPEVRDVQSGARHLRLHGERQHRQVRLPCGAGGALVRHVVPDAFRQRPHGAQAEARGAAGGGRCAAGRRESGCRRWRNGEGEEGGEGEGSEEGQEGEEGRRARGRPALEAAHSDARADPVRHRSGPVLPHDARRGAATRPPEARAAALLVHPVAARRQLEDERLHRVVRRLPHRHA